MSRNNLIGHARRVTTALIAPGLDKSSAAEYENLVNWDQRKERPVSCTRLTPRVGYPTHWPFILVPSLCFMYFFDQYAKVHHDQVSHLVS
jgi:hypothetical protein